MFEINELITCKKKIIKAPKKDMILEKGQLRNDMRLISEDGKYEFTVFMRQSNKFAENFSIGLRYCSKEKIGDMVLLRCNGPHGAHLNKLGEDPKFHNEYHIHKITIENINNNLKHERDAEITKEFSTFEDALFFFINYCNIEDSENYFKFLKEPSLFNEKKMRNDK